MRDYAYPDRQSLIQSVPLPCPLPLARARARHGKPFAADPGSPWQPHKVPVLTAWANARRIKRDLGQLADVLAV